MTKNGKAAGLFARLRRGIPAAGVALALCTGQAAAQADYPTRTVRLAVGFGAGTPPDLAARTIAEKLARTWGKPVVVENVVGASGDLAGERIARAEPDGHTLLIAGNAGIVINPALFRTMRYDPVRDLAPVTVAYTYPNVLIANNELGVGSVRQLVELARSRPGELSYGSAGPGTSLHLAGEMLKSMAKIDVQHVPYRGGLNLIADLISNRIQFYFGPTASTLEQARRGTATALAVTSPARFSLAPDIPTMKEAGFPDFEMDVWWGLMAPAATPAPIIAKLYRDTAAALASPDTRARFANLGVEPVGNTPDAFAAIIRAELPKWSRLIRDAGIRLD